tara:strand:- start:382 stop:1104 length:723 start_codon:yes stop_codon:yes gene_type:complete
MHILLTILFIGLMYVCVIINVTIFLICYPFISNYKLVGFLTPKWCKAVLFLLKTINKVSYQVIDLEKMPDEPCIIACKHQSMWDTLIFHLLVKAPAYVYKKELHKVPVYGIYIKQMKMIPIDRSASGSALRDMIKKSKDLIHTQKRKLVIFPQGTRVPIGRSIEDYPYQIGVAALYSSLNVKVVPVALNSGKFWGKGCFIKNKGKIKLQILDPIEPGLSKKEFMKVLEEKIETASKELVK